MRVIEPTPESIKIGLAVRDAKLEIIDDIMDSLPLKDRDYIIDAMLRRWGER
ncbi:MAG: hypothetical protein H0U59_01225 [Gemmatimonadaceae bacterium]|nr:hypothetical protein [Gemmatimonadaceae bacterium]